MISRWRATIWAAIVLGLALVLTSPTLAQTPTFSTRVEVVRVDVLVTENGRPVVGLRPTDFEILDNGVRQQVEFAGLEHMPLNLILALDASDSVAGVRLEHLRAASEALLDGLNKGDQAALVTFNEMLALGSPLTSDLRQVRQAIRAVAPGGDTALIDALYAGIAIGESDIGRSLLVVFTDGADTASFLRRQVVNDAAKSTDVVVYPVASGLSGRRVTAFLKDVADQTGGRLFEIESTRDAQRAFVGILDEFRQRYLLSYTPRSLAMSGWHRLEVRVKGRRAAVKARAGYQGSI
jgi:VWFA-related protein